MKEMTMFTIEIWSGPSQFIISPFKVEWYLIEGSVGDVGRHDDGRPRSYEVIDWGYAYSRITARWGARRAARKVVNAKAQPSPKMVQRVEVR